MIIITTIFDDIVLFNTISTLGDIDKYDHEAMPIINTWRLNERHYGGLQAGSIQND